MKNTISAVISAYNEEKNIERCLKSLGFVDEIIVVDHESTDNTGAIAKKLTDKVYSEKNDPTNIDMQKNFGFSKASSDWILSIDADEEVSPELAKEIKTKIDNDSGLIGFWIPRKNYMFGKWIKENTGWYPDYQLRLFRKGKGKYESKHVHEDLKVDGETEKLTEHLIHHNYESVAQYVGKIMIYAPNEAEELIRKGYKLDHFDVIRFPLRDFLNWFFARNGYRDGFHGLVLALFQAIYHFLVFAFIWEKQGFPEYEGDDFLGKTETELKNAASEVDFWINKSKTNSTKNPLKKTFVKIKNKIK